MPAAPDADIGPETAAIIALRAKKSRAALGLGGFENADFRVPSLDVQRETPYNPSLDREG